MEPQVLLVIIRDLREHEQMRLAREQSSGGRARWQWADKE